MVCDLWDIKEFCTYGQAQTAPVSLCSWNSVLYWPHLLTGSSANYELIEIFICVHVIFIQEPCLYNLLFVQLENHMLLISVAF